MERAHRDGVLSAASLMVAGPAAAQAVSIARRNPRLRVGLHVVLVEGVPALDPAEISRLTDAATGRFRDDMLATSLVLAASAAARRQMAREVEAQFRAFAATGLPCDHVNAHKHVHVHPLIASEVIAACLRHHVRGLRAPVEPRGLVGRAPGTGLDDLFARLLRGRARRAGLVVPDQVFGLAWTGAMTAERLAGLVPRLPGGFTEIYTHPATADAFPGSAPGYRYRDEWAALTDPAVIAAVRAGPQPAGFADIAP